MNMRLKNFDAQLLEPEDVTEKRASEVIEESQEEEEREAERMTERIWRKVLADLGKSGDLGA